MLRKRRYIGVQTHRPYHPPLLSRHCPAFAVALPAPPVLNSWHRLYTRPLSQPPTCPLPRHHGQLSSPDNKTKSKANAVAKVTLAPQKKVPDGLDSLVGGGMKDQKDRAEFKRRLGTFYVAHNSEHTAPAKLDSICAYYYDRQDEVCARAAPASPRCAGPALSRYCLRERY